MIKIYDKYDEKYHRCDYQYVDLDEQETHIKIMLNDKYKAEEWPDCIVTYIKII